MVILTELILTYSLKYFNINKTFPTCCFTAQVIWIDITYTRGKLIYDTKRWKEDQLQSLKYYIIQWLPRCIYNMHSLFTVKISSSEGYGLYAGLMLDKYGLGTPHALAKCINWLRPRWNRRRFADDIFKCIFLNENVWISIEFPLKFVPKGPINNIPALVQIMAWCRPGDKSLSEPMMNILLTHICVTRPQWVKRH